MRILTLLTMLVLCGAGTDLYAGGKPNPKVLLPSVTIPLESLGYQPIPTRFLSTGSTMFSLAFVDNEHLLLTYNTRTLLRRGGDEPADDDDRTVAAVLLELPSGKVLARTTWHTHDHGRYLWALGQGRFLLRIRYTLTVIEPLAHLAGGDAFHEDPFLDMKRRIGFVYVAPERDMLAIETLPPPEPPLIGGAASAAALAAVSPDAPKPDAPKPAPKPVSRATADSAVQISLFRMNTEERAGGGTRLLAIQAGFIRADGLIHIASTGRGNLRVSRDGDRGYAFDFESHGGKKMPLGVFDSSCPPRIYWVSDSEFVAFGCLGSPDKHSLSEFDLRGQEPWIAALQGTLYAPYIDPAPLAGRFAYSHVVVDSANFNEENVTPEELKQQEIIVYQNHDGHQLLHALATPVQTAGQNFDLSPDGLSFAVLHEGRIEVTRLPPLTGKDEHELKLAREAVPPVDTAPILLSSVPVASKQQAEAVVIDTHQSPDASVVGDSGQSLPAQVIERGGKSPVTAADADIVGDIPPNGPRKPPSLYDPDHPKQPNE